jgi:hypothetical protein
MKITLDITTESMGIEVTTEHSGSRDRFNFRSNSQLFRFSLSHEWGIIGYMGCREDSLLLGSGI